MSTDFSFSKEKLEKFLKELGKEFRNLYGKQADAEIILIGGASVAINYNFRDMTTDADALIKANAAIKDAINRVGDKNNLPHGWMNDSFKNTPSYTDKLRSVSVHHRKYYGVLEIRTIKDKYLIAMKAMSGRQYKFDLSDIVGILSEHNSIGNPISRESINNAIIELYGHKPLPETSLQFLDDVFSHGDYERLYLKLKEIENENKEILLDFDLEYPNVLDENNKNDIIEKARRKKEPSKLEV